MAARTGALRPIDHPSKSEEDDWRFAGSLRAIAVAGLLGLALNSAASSASAADQEQIAPPAGVDEPTGEQLSVHQ